MLAAISQLVSEREEVQGPYRDKKAPGSLIGLDLETACCLTQVPKWSNAGLHRVGKVRATDSENEVRKSQKEGMEMRASLHLRWQF